MSRPGQNRIAKGALTLAAALALAVTLLASGFAACTLPPATTLLAGAFSGCDNPDTPFSHEQLVQAAQVTRDYTVGEHDAEAVHEMVRDINEQAGTRFAAVDWDVLAKAPDQYTLTDDALSHLDDVYYVVAEAIPVLACVAVAALAGLLACWRWCGRRRCGGVLLGAGLAVLVAFAALGGAAAVDFDGFFALFHSLFFASGTWVFYSDSLLITMYPTPFWMGMGGVWLATTAVLSLACCLAGWGLLRR